MLIRIDGIWGKKQQPFTYSKTLGPVFINTAIMVTCSCTMSFELLLLTLKLFMEMMHFKSLLPADAALYESFYLPPSNLEACSDCGQRESEFWIIHLL